MKTLTMVLLQWNMQSLLIYGKQWIMIICGVINGFRGWPEFLNYTTSVEKIRFYLHKEAKASIFYYSQIQCNTNVFVQFLTIIKNQVNSQFLCSKNWKLHGVKKVWQISL